MYGLLELMDVLERENLGDEPANQIARLIYELEETSSTYRPWEECELVEGVYIWGGVHLEGVDYGDTPDVEAVTR